MGCTKKIYIYIYIYFCHTHNSISTGLYVLIWLSSNRTLVMWVTTGVSNMNLVQVILLRSHPRRPAGDSLLVSWHVCRGGRVGGYKHTRQLRINILRWWQWGGGKELQGSLCRKQWLMALSSDWFQFFLLGICSAAGTSDCRSPHTDSRRMRVRDPYWLSPELPAQSLHPRSGPCQASLTEVGM